MLLILVHNGILLQVLYIFCESVTTDIVIYHFEIILAQMLFACVQQPAPDFKGTAVINDDFKEIKLADYKGKYLVLLFYPLDL